MPGVLLGSPAVPPGVLAVSFGVFVVSPAVPPAWALVDGPAGPVPTPGCLSRLPQAASSAADASAGIHILVFMNAPVLVRTRTVRVFDHHVSRRPDVFVVVDV